MLEAFRRHYPNTSVAYSYKTNYLPRLCQLVDQWGGYAEVVSGLEYAMARRFGVSPERIIYNGPYKTESDLATAVQEGALVNLDGPRQLAMLKELLAARPAKARIGVRITFPLDASRPSRFGFDAQDVAGVVAQLNKIEGVVLEGLHCHFATGSRSLAAYAEIAGRMLAIADRVFTGAPPRFLDIGGGFYSHMPDELRDQFSSEIPSHADYGQVVGQAFADHYGANGGPELIIEPGVSVTADIMEFAAQVLEVRTVNARRIALVGGSIHTIKPTLNSMNLPMRIVGQAGRESPDGPLDVVGYTCMEHDVLHRGFSGDLSAGQWIVVGNVGAYTNVLKPPFIRAAPPILSIEHDGSVEVLRRHETIDDILAAYVT